MEQFCKSCINLRHGLHLARRTFKPTTQRPLLLPTYSQLRSYSIKDRTSERKYRHGKLIVEHVEDPTLYPFFLMIFSGTDQVVLDAYLHEVKKAAKMVDVNLTKSFNLPAIEETHKAKREGKGLVSEVVYHLKQYQRVVEIQELTGEKSDIFLDYIQESMPAGVKIDISLKRWEKLVEPNHIMFREEN
ncbi:small ribosomal subunit protein uS10m-like [Clytia hemisphaerica]|uniref:small ribosomal subunit protein uS10m-like n=1 Tax=Clytia hemisphaerica TaxID=252671 RepID=UPI0034D49203|eukprot:TCONS_00017096-protein